jgi:hypothetical protein
MRPAGLRGTASQDTHIFRTYTTLIADQLREEAGAPPGDFEDWFLWSQAIAQHYGPGTQFLDVTTSLDTALWFALHAAASEPSGHVFGPPGPFDAATDVSAVLARTRFERRGSGSGFLHVFDAPVWDGSTSLDHGDLVDLAHAPDVFASSPRLQAQHACLLYADAGRDDGDLRPQLVGDPIPVSWPMSGSSCDSMTSEDLFPGPAADPWYRRLLSIPLVHRLNADANRLELSQAIPTTLYLGDEDVRPDVIGRLIVVHPDLLWPHLYRELEANAAWLPDGFRPTGATPIVLEFPVFVMTPPLESGDWHHGIAVADLPDSTTAHDPVTGGDVEVALDKVLVEFSPLELAVWDQVETTNEEISFERGAYVERNGTDFKLWMISQLFPSAGLRVAGPFLFAYNEDTGHIEIPTKTGTMPIQWPGKTLLAVLTILRELSSDLIACPFPSLSAAEGPVVVHLQGAAARLVKVPTSDSAEPVYLLRGTNLDAPFAPSMMNSGILVLAAPPPWTATDVNAIRSSIRSQANARNTRR